MKGDIRVGCGFDVHAFCAGDHVCIGGVNIPFEYGVKAHSDGDVLLHALCDALLGAAALGDIGRHFPDTDNHFKDIASSNLVEQVGRRLTKQGYRVVNVDATVIAEAPRLLPFIPEIKHSVGKILGITKECVNIKATTTETLGFIGRRQGLAAQCVVLIERI